ncbi:ATP-dependent Lon protease [Thermoflexus hugenholtzii JAD2]|uniref:Lon protease n=2 Tax=Thermoflexus TaxID=1495649 RepID=A0A212QHF9_9CHLR|nr:ATP-dependent Lon protease [Thermoflexus hugenholtzii JAD2]
MMWARPLGFEWEGYLLGDEGEEIPPMGVRPEPERGGEEPAVEIPEELPILPLRGVVVYPLTVVPLAIGQPRSIRLVDDVVLGKKLVGLVASKRPELEEPMPEDCYTVGTLALIQRLLRMPDGTMRILVLGLERIRILEYTATQPYLKARVERHPETMTPGPELEALRRKTAELFARMVELVPGLPDQLGSMAMAVEDPRQLAYAVATYLRMSLQEAQEILELDDVAAKLHKLIAILTREIEVLELGRKIQSEAQAQVEKMQREFFLRQQLEAIRRELGEADEHQMEIEEFRRKIEEAGMPPEARREALRELERMAKLPPASAEYGVIRTYLDWMVSLPWNKTTPDNLDVAHARKVLDEDHYGLQDVKERILEYLAVRKLKQERAAQLEELETRDYIRRAREGAILCFVGPPGVGKTSLGQSIARAMGRKFTRIALGGIRDEAEIRGFRRTYVGAMPGRIIQALRRVESRNPVFMLDEVDKIGADWRGDPASALLEVLDPEQNREFRDHYLDVPFDLSQVLFICTANQLDTIPAPLRDRMEIIFIPGYTETEKFHIAMGYLIPRQLRENGLLPGEITFTEAAVRRIIREYTREAGVRNLERAIGRVCRKVATRIAEGATEAAMVDAEDVPRYLGKPLFTEEEITHRVEVPGVAIGLAWTPTGGDVLFIEATRMPGSKGFVLTGSLGEVMRESAQAALSYVRAHAKDYGIPERFFDQSDIHIHVPAGAVPKDGPSAGITIVTALVSLLTDRPVRPDVGMTGEITLRGKVLPVGGIKEKALAAHRVGLRTVILPKRNEKDLEDVPEDVRQAMQFVLVETIDEALQVALQDRREGARAVSKDGARRSRAPAKARGGRASR